MPRTTDLPKTEILQLYEQGMTVQALADRYEREFSTMRANLHRWGASMRRRGPTRTHTLTEDFFSVIDSEEKAYWLGFLFADGCVQKTIQGNWTLKVELADKDRGHLVKLATALSSTAPIVPVAANKSNYLLVCSVKLCSDLCKLGCVPDKTCNHGTPDLPAKLYRHFYRGAVDGDGSLMLAGKTRQWRCELTGAAIFVEEFQDWLMTNAGVDRTKMFKHTRAWSVRYTGTQQVRRIARLLYEDAIVSLDRKQARYEELLDHE